MATLFSDWPRIGHGVSYFCLNSTRAEVTMSALDLVKRLGVCHRLCDRCISKYLPSAVTN